MARVPDLADVSGVEAQRVRTLIILRRRGWV
jgi:hypothetical protein